MKIAVSLMFALAVGMLTTLPLLGATRAAEEPHFVAADRVAAGRLLVNYGGCNDCHTPRWNELHDRIPESRRLIGNPIGFRGPWGTSYASNLRLAFASMSEAQWLALVHDPRGVAHPPMPWFNISVLSAADQRAIYAYIRSLGPAGKPATAYTAPASH